MRTKILFFLPNGYGGAENITLTIAKSLNRNSFSIKFVIVDNDVNNIYPHIPSGYEFCLLKIRNIWDFTFVKMVNLLKNEHPNVVFCSLAYLNLRLTFAAKIMGGVKTIIRQDNYLCTYRLDVRLGIKYLYPKADVIIAQQEEMHKELAEFINNGSDKIITLHNPIDIARIENNLKSSCPYTICNETRFVFVGRMQPTKGIDTLLKAFAIVRRNLNNAHLYILSKMEDNLNYYKTLRSYVKENDLDNFVHFEGFQENPHIWEKYAHCFVLSSRIEGLPNALTEAMYIGTPVVATTCIPIISRIVKNGYNGYTVAVDNEVEMAEAMQKAICLDNFTMTYIPSKIKDFISLFEINESGISRQF